MNFNNVAIESIAYGLPEEVWTSADLEAKMATVYERLHLPEGRLELMTGIKAVSYTHLTLPTTPYV